MSYSHTRIAAFEECPLKYRYKYVDRVTATLGETVEAFMGSRVHEALEKLYRDVAMCRLPTVEELIGRYEENWEKRWDDSIRVIRSEYCADDYRRKGRQCIERYYRRCYPFDRGRAVGIERRVELDLGGGRKLTGIIDRLVALDGGVYEIHDYKTSARLPSQEEADRDRQLALYQAAVQSLWSDVEKVYLVWHYLVFDKELRSTRTPQELESLIRAVGGIIDTIESATDFEPNASPLCEWCEFRNSCPVWKHLFVTEALAPEEFGKEEGVKLADRYTAVLREERRLEEEKEGLRKALADFCAAFGYEVVYGTDQKVRVKKVKHIRFPSPGDEMRAKMEEALREAGRWGEFSSLNTHKLEAALRGGKLPGELARRLGRFYTEEEGIRLSVSDIRSEEK